jgi:hypothetical protein
MMNENSAVHFHEWTRQALQSEVPIPAFRMADLNVITPKVASVFFCYSVSDSSPEKNFSKGASNSACAFHGPEFFRSGLMA